MKRTHLLIGWLMAIALAVNAQGLDTTKWPPLTDFTAEVHYWSADGFLTGAIPAGKGTQFLDSLSVLTGGDQVTTDVVVGGLDAKKSESQYFNVADQFFDLWPDIASIDVLVLYFANSESKRDNLGFLLGTLGNLHGVGGYTFESVADQYQWRLFRVDNSGGWAGNQVDTGATAGGVNGGTIRLENTNGLIIRAVAFAPAGVFGEPEDINISTEVEFNPDNYGIMAEWDINKGVKNGLDVYRVTSGDQEIVESPGIGPAGDQRKAIRPAMDNGTDGTRDIYVNWEILNEIFGPTTQPSARFKIVAEYYDDPALTGTVFGPEAYYSVGNQIAFFPEAQRTVLEGSGKWKEALWYVTDVKLTGVNVPTQAAARFVFTGPVYVSRLRLGVIRTSGIYEGVDPIPNVYPFDPDPYGIYAELDLNTGLVDNLDMSSSGGDQEYIIEEGIGPDNDKRRAVRPALGEGADSNFDRYMNFMIQNEVFGPISQPNAKIKMAYDYYDDPALAGERFGPEVYQTNVFGVVQIKFYPAENRLTLEGTGEWRTVAWVIDDVNFTGVNVSPGAVRLWFSDNCAVYISRVRYAVIRPVGKNAGVDMLADIEPYPTAVQLWDLY